MDFQVRITLGRVHINNTNCSQMKIKTLSFSKFIKKAINKMFVRKVLLWIIKNRYLKLTAITEAAHEKRRGQRFQRLSRYGERANT